MRRHLYRIGVLSRQLPAAQKETWPTTWHLDPGELGPALGEVFPAADVEAVAISTDARLEIYLASLEPQASSRLRELFARLVGCVPCSFAIEIERDDSAILRLFRATSGLDAPAGVLQVGPDAKRPRRLGHIQQSFEEGRVAESGSLLRWLGLQALAVGHQAAELSSENEISLRDFVREEARTFTAAWRGRLRLAEKRLVLAAHGAGEGSEANRAIERLADEVSKKLSELLDTKGVEAHGAATGSERRATVAFHLGEPAFEDLTGQHALVLPLLTSRGFFYRRLERALGSGPELLDPIGMDPRLASAISRQIREKTSDIPPSDLVILVVGHGTKRYARSGEATERLARRCAENFPGAHVEAAFLDQEPTFTKVLERIAGDPGLSPRTRIAVVPFLLGHASHAEDDIHIAAELLGERALLLPPILDLEGLPQILIDMALGGEIQPAERHAPQAEKENVDGRQAA